MLQNKTAVVTGSSSGIGSAIAVELAAQGANVFLHARQNEAGLLDASKQIANFDRETASCLADLSDSAGRQELVQSVFEWRSEIDIWINNAGGDVLTGAMADADFYDKLRFLWQIDVEATVELSRTVGPRLSDGGVILNMGWDQAQQGMAGDAGEMFGTIKGAVMAFTKSLAQTLAPRVRVNCIAPGWIKTEWAEGASEYWQQRAREECLRDRWGTPKDVAVMAAFLSSSSADFITGQTMEVNGGFRFRIEDQMSSND